MGYDYVVVGAGMFGAAFARTMADRGRKVLLVEKNDFVGGACYTESVGGVHVHRFGPHIFHTDSLKIWEWVQRFGAFKPFTLRSKAKYQGKVYSLPFNLSTFSQLWGVTTPAEAEERLKAERVRIPNPRTVEEWALSQLGREVYEKLVRGYTLKQWGRDPAKLSSLILKRLPIRTTFNDNYFSDTYQGVPVEGFTALFHRMLEGIEVRLSCDFFDDRESLERMGRVVYSGRLDRLFDYRFDPLEFRTLRFETKIVRGDYQGVGLVYHTEAEVPHTRTLEHKHLGFVTTEDSPVSWEYSAEGGLKDEPLYPINDARNNELAKKYLACQTDAVIGGRQGTYKYMDMDQVIAQAIMLADRLVAPVQGVC